MSDETTQAEGQQAVATPRDEITTKDGETLTKTAPDGNVELEGGRLVDAGANKPGGQHDTNAGNADTQADITGTTPIGTTADDQPNVRPLGADGNPLEVPDDDPRLQVNPDQPDLEVPATDTADEAVPAGTGDSTDANEG